MASSEASPTMKMLPRDYQVAIYKKVKVGNHLLVLETGAGKTLVSIMLIKDALEGEREKQRVVPKYKKKFIVYLVNNVHLVLQQAQAIRNSIDAKVRTFHGDCGIDLRSHVIWKEEVVLEEVLIMTAQIFLNVLRHGFVNLQHICLLIFDECHHARKNHPFNMIMQEFYHCTPVDCQPQIFGMTASPTNSKQTISLAQMELSRNLNSKLVTAKPTEQLKEAVCSPEHVFLGYDSNYGDFKSPFLSSIQPLLNKLPEFKKMVLLVQNAYEELGNWGANLLLLELMNNLTSEHTKNCLINEVEKSETDDFEPFQSYTTIVKLWEVHSIHINEFANSEIQLNNQYLSNKVIVLVNKLTELLNRYKLNFRGIIFVTSRCISYLLDKILSRWAGFETIRVNFITGHGSSKVSPFFQMSLSQQDSIIRKFREGDIDLLIATNVAEEGLDIQPCNVVIRFDPLTTLVSYIQSRGRARAKHSTYVILYDQLDSNQCRRSEDLIQMESELPEILQQTSTLQELYGIESSIKDRSNLPVYLVPSTGAKITFNSSLDLLAFYSSFLKTDAYTNRLALFDMEQVEAGFRCHMTLPSSCSVRYILGDVYPTKSLAKQSAAWKGCVDLHQSKAINDHLIPINEFASESSEFVEPEAFNNMGTHKIRHSYEFKSPDLWLLDDPTVPDELYLNQVEMTIVGRRPFIIATRRPIPSLPSIPFINMDFSTSIRILPALSTTPIATNQFKQLVKFNTFVFSMVLSKKLACPSEKAVYLFAPLKPGLITDSTVDLEALDWDSISNLDSAPLLSFGSHGLENRLLINKLDSNRVLRIVKVHTSLNAHSPIIGNEDDVKISLAQYIQNHLNNKTIWPNLPLIETDHITNTINYLHFQSCQPKKKLKRNQYKSKFVLVENSLLHPIKYDVYLSGLLLPSLLSRIDAYLLAIEVKERYHLDIYEHHLTEALTLPSANLAMDYERLELLGDSFLKFMATVYLYVTQPTKNEGQLHCHRIRKISNKTLFAKCRELELPQYFTGMSLDKSKWRPPNFINLDSKEDLQLTNLQLNDKCLADVMEALIGSAIQSNGELGGLQCLMRLGLCFDDVSSWDAIRNMYAVPKPLESHLSSLLDWSFFQEVLSYSFRNPFLLLESLTHTSARIAFTPNYQRLEFLGDAVLDYLVVRELVKAYPIMPPGFLTELKGLMVDNPTLARIAVHADLPRHLKRSSDALDDAIFEFMSRIKKDKGDSSAFQTQRAVNIPKPFSDIVESIVGAVFVDSGLDLSAAKNVVLRLAEPTYQDILVQSKPNINRPYKHLIRCFSNEGCRGLETSLEIQEETTLYPGQLTFRCSFAIHGVTSAHGFGPSEKLARDSASQQLLLKLNKNPHSLKNCPCLTK